MPCARYFPGKKVFLLFAGRFTSDDLSKKIGYAKYGRFEIKLNMDKQLNITTFENSIKSLLIERF